MRDSKKCPKCQSENIMKFDGNRSTPSAYEAGNNLSLGFLSFVMIDRFVCCDCGFTEEWIDRDD